jgi:hypothetical protein
MDINLPSLIVRLALGGGVLAVSTATSPDRDRSDPTPDSILVIGQRTRDSTIPNTTGSPSAFSMLDNQLDTSIRHRDYKCGSVRRIRASGTLRKQVIPR